jgi:class 3 adenylate cyclase
MDIVVWLRSLGLGRYEAAFRDNEIDESVLPSLTAEDLKDLGVSIVGHRRKLLDAIAALRTDADATPSSGAATTSAPSVSPEDRAERRQVTVMFSDLVGSTALSARMDPEDLREVIAAYQKCVAETVRRFGGFVAQFLGDGVLVYFGYPEAHEDDAERAVRAGLELIAAVIALKTSASLQTRVGIATGLVVVGDLMTGAGEAHERGIVGETPNLAARLQGIAEPNTVVIAEATRRLLGNLFELKDLGARDLKGVAEPLRAWVALRASTVESRFEALHAAGLTALVGREEEIELLRRRWSKTKTGEGQVVLLSGEAGIGKSRLTAAAYRRYSVVRRGDDQGGAGSRERDRGCARDCRGSVSNTGGPCEPLCLAHGAARPARRPGQGAGPDRGGNRPRVFPCPARLCGAPAGGGAEISVGPSHRGWFAVPTRHAPACNLPVQACPRAGRSLRDAAARAATHTACPHRRNHRERLRGKR